MSLAKQEFTNAGRSMLGRAQNGERLTISKIVVGSGSATQPSDLWPLTALVHFEMNCAISTKNDFGDGTLLIEGSLRSIDAPHAFDLKEVGVMAHIAAEADRLYSVANVFLEAPDHIDPAAPTIQVFKIKLIIERIPTGNITFSISPSENVVGENLGADTVGPGVYKDAAGNILHFKRLVQGANMDIHDSTDGNSIYVGMNLLPNNVDLYVPMGYANPPAGALLFPTIQEAHDYLLTFTIPPDKRATIHLDAGVFSGAGNSPCAFYHPNASQITVIGRPRVDFTITAGPNYVDATHKNVTLSGNLAALIVGLPVYLMNTDTGWAGGCYITAKAGQVVTLSVIKRDAQTAYNINNSGALGACRLSYLPTVIYEANPNPGQPWAPATSNVICGNNMTVQNLCIIGGYHILSVPGTRSSISNIFCLGTGGDGATGISAGDNCVVGWPSDVVVTDCGFGLGGKFTAHNLNVNVCANACNCGIAAEGVFGAVPGVVTATGKIYLVHNATAARNWGATTEFGNVFFAKNDVGFEAANLGVFIFGNVGGNWPQLNGANKDLWAHGMGYINYSKGGGPTPTSTPAANTYGQGDNSFISVN
jgi:hypothetical protein